MKVRRREGDRQRSESRGEDGVKTDGGRTAGLKLDSELKTNLISSLTLWVRDTDSDRRETDC